MSKTVLSLAKLFPSLEAVLISEMEDKGSEYNFIKEDTPGKKNKK
jgi:hypothetical protein